MLARDAARALREVARRACARPRCLRRSTRPGAFSVGTFRGTDPVESRLPASARARGAASSSALVGERSTRSRASVRGHSRRFASERPSRGASRDKIHLESLVFHGYHGVLPEEKALGQKFVVDVTMSVCHLRSGASDDIADTVDYAAAYELIRREVEGKENAKDLIERVGAGVADALLRAFPNAKDVAVRVRKPHALVAGVVGRSGSRCTGRG